ncbi:transposable element Tcb1 transposase [Trichonephila clavipes]|nr:transposable element Tcb1 transposase [Trichonephila clavipes]
MSRRKQPSAFVQVSELDRGWIVAYRDCGLSFREIVTHLSATPRWSDSSLETQWREDAEQLQYAPGIMVWDGIGYHSRTPLVRIAGLGTAIFQQDNARPHVARIVQRFFVNPQIELLLWPARSSDLSPIENMWFMVAQRLIQITPPPATPDYLWQSVEADCSAASHKNASNVSLNQCRSVW